jgi:hypothetical protein
MASDRVFPQWEQVPSELIEMDGPCGLVAAWSVLNYFGKSVLVPKLVQACGHTKRHGVFTVALATGLKEFGLQVAFHTDLDDHIGGFEKRWYARARRVGLVVEPPVDLSFLLRQRRLGRIPIVFFNTDSDVGHFSPLLGVRNGELRLPMAEGGSMRIDDFLAKWSAEGIHRQCAIAGMH